MTAATPTLKARVRRIAPYFAGTRRGFVLVRDRRDRFGVCTEPAIPALLKPLLDSGFSKAGAINLWLVPVAIVGLFFIRGIAGFIAQYGLTWSANRAILALRSAMFARLLDASPALFTRNSASSLTNTLTFEVQTGATLLINSLLTLVKDSLALVALLGLPDLPELAADTVRRRAVPVARARDAAMSRRLHKSSTAIKSHSPNATRTLPLVLDSPSFLEKCVGRRSSENSPAEPISILLSFPAKSDSCDVSPG